MRTPADLYRNCVETVIEDRVPENTEEILRQLRNYALLKGEDRHAADTLGHLESSDIWEIPGSLIQAIDAEMDRKGMAYERR